MRSIRPTPHCNMHNKLGLLLWCLCMLKFIAWKVILQGEESRIFAFFKVCDS